MQWRHLIGDCGVGLRVQKSGDDKCGHWERLLHKTWAISEHKASTINSMLGEKMEPISVIMKNDKVSDMQE